MILVTGGTGLLGLHLLMDLYRKGQEARVISRKTEWPKHVSKVLQHNGIDPDAFFKHFELVKGDVTDLVSLEPHFEGVTHVYHCAALVSFKQSDYTRLMDINVNGTSHVVNLCLSFDVKKLCYVSSTAAIGKKSTDYGKDTLVIEDGEWVRELNSSNYAKSKFLAEREVWRAEQEGLDVVIVNPCVVLGPGNWDESSAVLFKQAKSGLKYYTEGSNAFVDARDVSNSMLQLMDGQMSGERYLVIGHNMAFRDLFTLLSNAFDQKSPSRKASRWMSNLGWRVEGVLSSISGRAPRITKETVQSAHSNIRYSNQKIMEATGMEFRPIEDTIAHCVEYYK